jgi:hypothetical protein
LEYKIIEPKIKEDKRFRPLIYIEKKKLFIVENIKYSNESVEFYTIDENNKEFSLILIKKIMFKEEEFYHNHLSDSYNNCCVIQEKYLLIGAKANFYRDGGIYIINLDNYNLIKYRGFFRSSGINCLLNISNNIVICSSKKETKKGINNIIINNRNNNSNNNIKNKKTRKRNRKYRLRNKKKYNNTFWNKDYKINKINIINQEQNANNINNKINDETKKIKSKSRLFLFEIKEKHNEKYL